MTTETSEALAKASNTEGLMKSSYFKLKFNPETGQWEKEQIEAVIDDPVFPGIRDVTPNYTEEGKTFRTIPIGAGPDYSPVTPAPVPELPTQPVEPEPTPTPVPTPEDTTPVEVGGSTDDTRGEGIVVKKNTTQVTIDGLNYNTSIIKPPASYRDKYSNLPGGLNNWSESQLLNYAIDTGALNSILPQNANPYYIAPTDTEQGMFGKAKDALMSSTMGMVAGGLDATLGAMERKALVKRMVEVGLISGSPEDYVDGKGNFKVNSKGELRQVFADNNTRTSLKSNAEPGISIEFDGGASTQIPPDTPSGEGYSGNTVEEYFNGISGEVYNKQELEKYQNELNRLQPRYDALFRENSRSAGRLSETELNELNSLKSQIDSLTVQINSIQDGFNMGLYKNDTYILDPRNNTRVMLNANNRSDFELLKYNMSRAPVPQPIPTMRYFDTVRKHSVSATGVLTPGISEGLGAGSPPKMGRSGHYTNGEAVYIDSTAGHYTSDGKYHVDTNGDGTSDKVVARGSASNAQEAANNGFIPEAVLSRMTNPDGSLKNLYTPGGGPTGNFALTNNIEQRADGKYYYTGNVVKENRDVVDTKNGKIVANAAKTDSEDNKSHREERQGGTDSTYVSEATKARQDAEKQMREERDPGGAERFGGGGSDSGGGDSGGSKDKDKIVCTEMYRQTQLDDWKRTIKLWYLFQKKYLSETHQKGYHFLFKPFVKGMQKSNLLTSIGRHFAQERTKDIKHIMYGTKFSLLGRVYRIILEPICFVVGLLLWQKK
jgi:hypothetical protein